MISEIRHNGQLFAMILSRRFNEPGIKFLTPNNLSLQLGYMRHPQGKVIEAHVHIPVTREVKDTFEVLFVKNGSVRVDFFDCAQNYLESRILEAGDTILLVSGGHGFEALEDLEMIEVKQGPYAEGKDKRCFKPKLPSELRYDTMSVAI